MGFLKWIRRTLHADNNKIKRSNKELNKVGVTQPDYIYQSTGTKESKTTRKSNLTRTKRTMSLSRDNNHIIRELPQIPQQESSLQWLDLNVVSNATPEHKYEEIQNLPVYLNIVNDPNKNITNKSGRLYVNGVASENNVHVNKNKGNLNLGYSCHADSRGAIIPQINYENIDNITRVRRLNSYVNLKCSNFDKKEIECHRETYPGHFFLQTRNRPEPIGCEDSHLDVGIHSSTTDSSSSDVSALDVVTPAGPRRTVPLQTPGWKWHCDATTFDVLPLENDDFCDDRDNLSQTSGDDTEDAMSMSMMIDAIKSLQEQLEIKKQKSEDKNRRRSCPQTEISRLL